MATENMVTGIDFHTHILPGIDDGAAELATSLRMIESLSRQHVDTIVLTPHFYTDQEPLLDFVSRRDEAYQLLRDNLPDCPVRFVVGAEVYLTKYLFSNEDIDPLFLGNSRALLVELPFIAHHFSDVDEMLQKLIDRYNATPILAHIDRYPYLWKDPDRLRHLRKEGCLFQVNFSAFFTSFFMRRAIVRLAQDGLIDVVGTDCHDLVDRPPAFSAGVKRMNKYVGEKFSEALMQNAHQIIS